MLYQSTIANILLPSVNWFFYDKGVNVCLGPPTPHTPLSCCVRLLPLLVCYSSRSYRGYHLHLTYPANTCSAFHHQTHNETHAQNLSHFYQWLGYIKNVARDTVTLVLYVSITAIKFVLCFVTQCISQLFFYTDCLIIKKYLLLGENL